MLFNIDGEGRIRLISLAFWISGVLFFMLSNCCPSIWMQPSQGPITIPTRKHTILAGEITQISHKAKNTMTILGQTFPITFHLPTINRVSLTKFHTLHSKILPLKRNWWRRLLKLWLSPKYRSCGIQDNCWEITLKPYLVGSDESVS